MGHGMLGACDRGISGVSNKPICYVLCVCIVFIGGLKSKWNNKLDKISPCATT